MKIAYGVMGYGRGHAMRTQAVLPSLLAEHEVTVFAGGDAYDALSGQFPTVQIPTLGYANGRNAKHSGVLTVSRNAQTVSDMLFAGPQTRALETEFKQREIELVISDSEISTGCNNPFASRQIIRRRGSSKKTPVDI